MIKIKKCLNHNVIQNILTIINEQYSQMKVNPHNVKEWNLVQVDLIKELIKLKKFNISDTKLILKFGKEFHDYAEDHNWESPSVKEMIELLDL